MPPPFWALHAGRRPFLLGRMRIAAALRQFFAARDFVEVETATLVPSPGNETHLHAFATDLVAPTGTRARSYLRTSPEFACKKLLAAGERRIVEFARSFRNRAIDPFAAPERLTVAEAFARHAGIDLAAMLPPQPAAVLAAAANAAGIRTAADDTWGDVFSRVLVEKIEPHLGQGRATILYEYPAVQSPLARPKAADPRLAERFELYACGVELANGFGELVDVVEQRQRLEHQMAEKERIYGERYPIDEDFLSALAVMPEACGIALGFDRLVMLATGATRIDEVVWTPMSAT